MTWLIVLAAVVVCALGVLMYRRRNVTDEHRTLRQFNPSDVRGRVATEDTMGPGVRSILRKDPGSPKY